MIKLLRSNICESHKQCTGALFTQKVNIYGLKKKKLKMQNPQNAESKPILVLCVHLIEIKN